MQMKIMSNLEAFQEEFLKSYIIDILYIYIYIYRGGFRGVSEVSGNHSGFSLDDGCGPFRL